ncbi:MAG: signal peptidase II [Faecalibacterium sp.]
MLLAILFVFNIVVLVGIDQAIKIWAVANLAPVGSMPFIPNLVELRFVLNTGMAFSMLSGKQGLLILFTGVMMVGVAYLLFFKSKGKTLQQVAFVLILAGGIGNLIDRATTGEVVDYINLLFMDFAIFNFADICVCVGAGLFILHVLLEGEEEPQKSEETLQKSQQIEEAGEA